MFKLNLTNSFRYFIFFLSELRYSFLKYLAKFNSKYKVHLLPAYIFWDIFLTTQTKMAQTWSIRFISNRHDLENVLILFFGQSFSCHFFFSIAEVSKLCRCHISFLFLIISCWLQKKKIPSKTYSFIKLFFLALYAKYMVLLSSRKLLKFHSIWGSRVTHGWGLLNKVLYKCKGR